MPEASLTEDQQDTLQEVMNMAFGAATAQLAEVVDVFVQLASPEVRLVPVGELMGYLRDRTPDFTGTSIVEQQFRGQHDGMAVLVFPRGAEKQLVSFFGLNESEDAGADVRLELEREVLMEIGNILIGATVGRLFELLGRQINYMPPRMTGGHAFEDLLLRGNFENNDMAISMRASFSFEDREVHGDLYIINQQSNIDDLKTSLGSFWENLE